MVSSHRRSPLTVRDSACHRICRLSGSSACIRKCVQHGVCTMGPIGILRHSYVLHELQFGSNVFASQAYVVPSALAGHHRIRSKSYYSPRPSDHLTYSVKVGQMVCYRIRALRHTRVRGHVGTRVPSLPLAPGFVIPAMPLMPMCLITIVDPATDLASSCKSHHVGRRKVGRVSVTIVVTRSPGNEGAAQ